MADAGPVRGAAIKLDGDGKSSKASALVRGSKPAWPRAPWALSRCGRWVAQVQFRHSRCCQSSHTGSH